MNLLVGLLGCSLLLIALPSCAGAGHTAGGATASPRTPHPVASPSATSGSPGASLWGPPPSCPVTLPNGNAPPGERPTRADYGNGELFTGLPPDGIARMLPHEVQPDGSLRRKFFWWRGPEIRGDLTLTGRRLDVPAPPLRAEIPEGYGLTGFQATALIFPAAGCWEVTGRAGDGSLTFVILVVPPGEQ